MNTPATTPPTTPDPGTHPAEAPPFATTAPPISQVSQRHPILWLLALIIVADALFWSAGPGLSLALFSAALFVAAWITSRHPKTITKPALVLILSSLPLIEHLHIMSVAFWAGGTCVAIALVRCASKPTLTLWLSTWVGFVLQWPKASPLSLIRTIFGLPFDWSSRRMLLRDWAFPIGGGLILMSLLIKANPIFSQAIISLLETLSPTTLSLENTILRPLFWIGVAILIWPALAVPAFSRRDFTVPAVSLPNLGINPRSALNALVMFNTILGLQTAMDLSILLGGAQLPEGMSHASYAHRGAYPLLATAVLAGLFALAARPFLGQNRWLRPLLMVWLGQNILICLSSGLRLDLYISAYGLTYLRIYSLIWMSVTALALSLIGMQILRARGNLWLLARLSGLGLVTLYCASFVNFAALIAETNLRLAHHETAPVALDVTYLCNLDSTAQAAILSGLSSLTDQTDAKRLRHCLGATAQSNWREWGFRQARVTRYVQDMKEAVSQ